MTRSNALSKPKRLPLVIADRIQDEVFARGLSVGDHLPTEAKLAEQHDVSRTVVREAARILEHRGLVDIRPGRGMTVAAPDLTPITRHYSLLLRSNPEAFDQLIDLRLLLEVQITGLAAEGRSEAHLERMAASLARIRDHRDDFDIVLEEDLRFHALVSEASGNAVMAMFLDPVNECLRETYRVPFAYLSRLDHTLEEHEAILKAISEQDVPASRLAATRHLQRIKSYTTGLIADTD